MTDYRLYFVDEKGAFRPREDFDAPDDDVALTVASSKKRYSAIIWQIARSEKVISEAERLRDRSRTASIQHDRPKNS
jgi:hypothetical protein